MGELKNPCSDKDTKRKKERERERGKKKDQREHRILLQSLFISGFKVLLVG